MQRKKLQIASALFLLGLHGACASNGVIKTTPAAELVRLDANYQVTESLGSTPVTLTDGGPISMLKLEKVSVGRFALQRAGSPDEQLVMLFPDKLAGDLEIPLGDSKSETLVSTFYNPYIDHLLRAQRLVLRGDLAEARLVLERLDERFDASFGSEVLRANIALLQGDTSEAVRRFAAAKIMLPGETTVDALPLPENPGGVMP